MKPNTTRRINAPEPTKWDRAKLYVASLRFRAETFAEEIKPHPIRKWKQADPRVKNLFVGAAIAAPGFAAAVAGGTNIIQTNDIIDACRNRPVAVGLSRDTCDLAQKDRSNGLDLVFGGSIEMLGVSGIAMFRDGMIASRQELAASQTRTNSRSRALVR